MTQAKTYVFVFVIFVFSSVRSQPLVTTMPPSSSSPCRITVSRYSEFCDMLMQRQTQCSSYSVNFEIDATSGGSDNDTSGPCTIVGVARVIIECNSTKIQPSWNCRRTNYSETCLSFSNVDDVFIQKCHFDGGGLYFENITRVVLNSVSIRNYVNTTFVNVSNVFVNNSLFEYNQGGLLVFEYAKFFLHNTILQHTGGSGSVSCFVANHRPAGQYFEFIPFDVYNVTVRNCTSSVMGYGAGFSLSSYRFLNASIRYLTVTNIRSQELGCVRFTGGEGATYFVDHLYVQDCVNFETEGSGICLNAYEMGVFALTNSFLGDCSCNFLAGAIGLYRPRIAKLLNVSIQNAGPCKGGGAGIYIVVATILERLTIDSVTMRNVSASRGACLTIANISHPFVLTVRGFDGQCLNGANDDRVSIQGFQKHFRIGGPKYIRETDLRNTTISKTVTVIHREIITPRPGKQSSSSSSSNSLRSSSVVGVQVTYGMAYAASLANTPAAADLQTSVTILSTQCTGHGLDRVFTQNSWVLSPLGHLLGDALQFQDLDDKTSFDGSTGVFWNVITILFSLVFHAAITKIGSVAQKKPFDVMQQMILFPSISFSLSLVLLQGTLYLAVHHWSIHGGTNLVKDILVTGGPLLLPCGMLSYMVYWLNTNRPEYFAKNVTPDTLPQKKYLHIVQRIFPRKYWLPEPGSMAVCMDVMPTSWYFMVVTTIYYTAIGIGTGVAATSSSQQGCTIAAVSIVVCLLLYAGYFIYYMPGRSQLQCVLRFLILLMNAMLGIVARIDIIASEHQLVVFEYTMMLIGVITNIEICVVVIGALHDITQARVREEEYIEWKSKREVGDCSILHCEPAEELTASTLPKTALSESLI